jgi:hypothetical protein
MKINLFLTTRADTIIFYTHACLVDVFKSKQRCSLCVVSVCLGIRVPVRDLFYKYNSYIRDVSAF